jgi:hypothetical protein
LTRELESQSFHELGAIELAGGLSRGDEDTHTRIMTLRTGTILMSLGPKAFVDKGLAME